MPDERRNHSRQGEPNATRKSEILWQPSVVLLTPESVRVRYSLVSVTATLGVDQGLLARNQRMLTEEAASRTT